MNHEYGPNADLPKIATTRWRRNTCFDKKGVMVLKYQTLLGNSLYCEEKYFQDKNNKQLST